MSRKKAQTVPTWKERKRELNKKQSVIINQKTKFSGIKKKQEIADREKFQEDPYYQPTTFLGCVDDFGILDVELWKEVCIDNDYSRDDYDSALSKFFRH